MGVGDWGGVTGGLQSVSEMTRGSGILMCAKHSFLSSPPTYTTATIPPSLPSLSLLFSPLVERKPGGTRCSSLCAATTRICSTR